MTIDELKTYLQQHQVPEHLYVIQELGAGEVDGVGFIDGAWTTYYSERGAYRHRQAYATEAAAVDAFLQQLRELLQAEYGQVLP
ncbi:MAG: hypothetical protein ACOVQT_04145 [Rubrivivax sp.]|jgi:hypothetical protein|nr:hypothetical protein [Rubrivivax sp.]